MSPLLNWLYHLLHFKYSTMPWRPHHLFLWAIIWGDRVGMSHSALFHWCHILGLIQQILNKGMNEECNEWVNMLFAEESTRQRDFSLHLSSLECTPCYIIIWCVCGGGRAFLLEYNCFTMLCSFLLYNTMNQLYVYVHLFPLGPPSHTLRPNSLGDHRTPSWAPCALQQVTTC